MRSIRTVCSSARRARPPDRLSPSTVSSARHCSHLQEFDSMTGCLGVGNAVAPPPDGLPISSLLGAQRSLTRLAPAGEVLTGSRNN